MAHDHAEDPLTNDDDQVYAYAQSLDAMRVRRAAEDPGAAAAVSVRVGVAFAPDALGRAAWLTWAREHAGQAVWWFRMENLVSVVGSDDVARMERTGRTTDAPFWGATARLAALRWAVHAGYRTIAAVLPSPDDDGFLAITNTDH